MGRAGLCSKESCDGCSAMRHSVDDTSHLPLLHKGTRVESCLPGGTVERLEDWRMNDGILGVAARRR